MAPVQGPAGPRRRLGAELRRLRGSVGLNLDEVARELDCSTSKISRLETGKGIPKLPDVRELIRIYGVSSDAEQEMLLRLVKDSRMQGWWEPYTEGVPPERFVMEEPARYPALETHALAVHSFTVTVVPGLLQSSDYTREMLTAILPQHRKPEIESLVELRMQRQRALYRDDAPLRLSVVLDEGLLCRVVGGREVMADQLCAIEEKADLPNVEVRVLPFDAGIHRAHHGQFNILELHEPLDDIVYIEGHAGDSYLDGYSDVELYKEVFSDVAERALDPDASRRMITEYVRAHNSAKGVR